jgi:phytoene dehydrogenase-like protein
MVKEGMPKGLIVQKAGEEFEIAAKAIISNTGPKKTVELAGSENFDIGYLKEVREKLRPAYHILFFIAMPSDRPLPARLYLTDTQRLFAIRCLTMACPELAPPGKHLIFASAAPGSSLPPINFKHEIELCLQDLKESLPDFDRYGEILKIHRFRGDWPLYRSWLGYELPPKTSIKNLYNVGDAVKPPNWVGLEACAESARIVVDDIKQRIEPSRV